MTSLNTLYAALSAALTAAGVVSHDGEPVATPAGPYVVTTDDTGLPLRASLADGHSGRWTVQVMCVARTRGGVRDLVTRTRAALLGARLDGNHPLAEVAAGPVLTGGPASDVRHSMTLVFQLTTRF